MWIFAGLGLLYWKASRASLWVGVVGLCSNAQALAVALPSGDPSGAADTAALQRLLDDPAQTTLTLRRTYVVTGLRLPAGKRLIGRGGTLRAAGGRSGVLLTLESGASVQGDLTLDGAGAHVTCLWSSGQGNLVIGTRIQNCAGDGIHFEGAGHYRISGTTILNSGDQAMDLIRSSHGVVSGNTVVGAAHGVQWWGGDSAVPTEVADMRDLNIYDNTVSHVTGGCIWGSLGLAIRVAHNRVEACDDVGIDFEGSAGQILNNVVRDTGNGGISFFFRAHDVRVTGNDVRTGRGHGLWFTTRAPSTRLTVRGNRFWVSGSGEAVRIESESLLRANIDDNDLAQSPRGEVGSQPQPVSAPGQPRQGLVPGDPAPR